MNEQLPQTEVRTTQFADGLPRRAWTVTEFEQASMAGLFDGNGTDEERLELLGGEIVPMSPKGARHELVRTELHHIWSANRGVKIGAELPLPLDESSQLQPDIVVFPASMFSSDLTADNVLLIVEIADTSLKRDIQSKAQLNAAAGVRDYWVINVNDMLTTVFRGPASTGYQSRHDVKPDEPLSPLYVPELELTLSDLGI